MLQLESRSTCHAPTTVILPPDFAASDFEKAERASSSAHGGKHGTRRRGMRRNASAQHSMRSSATGDREFGGQPRRGWAVDALGFFSRFRRLRSFSAFRFSSSMAAYLSTTLS